MKNKINQLYDIDARKINEVISEKIVDVIITSPPYADMKDYGIEDQIGYGQTYSKYLEDISKVFKSCYDICKKTSTLWMIIDTFKENGKLIPLPFDVVNELDKIGWILQDVIIWNKTKTLPYSRKGQLRNTFEYLLFFSKTSDFKYYIDRIKEPTGLKKWWVKYPERYNPKGKNPSNIWNYTIPTQGTWGNGNIRHHCPLPPKLIERILLLTTNKNNVVMDPFAGSGIVLAQAICMGRKYIGFELNKKYVDEFFPIVLPEIERRWEERIGELKKIKNAQDRLRRKIERLRKLKYTKVIAKKIINEFTDVDIEFLITLDHGSNDDVYLQEIKIIFKNKINETKIKEYVKTIVQKKPLSKYQIESKFSYICKENYHKEINQSKFYYLYLEGKFNYYEKKIYGKKLADEIYSQIFVFNKIPPILSDIPIRQKVPKDDTTPSILDMDI